MQAGKNEGIVLGAGIIGLNIAFQLARRGYQGVTVVDKAMHTGEGSSGASSAVLRHRYTFDEMVFFARDGIDAYRNWKAYTGLSDPDAEFNRCGVLWLPADDHFAVREARRLKELGVDALALDDAELGVRFPGMSACIHPPDLTTGELHSCSGGGRHLLETDAGFIDPTAALTDLLKACRRDGVDVRFGSAVGAIETRSGSVSGVKLTSGEVIESSVVVNAAGPWCNHLTAATGIHWPWELVPTRIQVVYLPLPAELRNIPVTVDLAGGIYFRPQNQGQQLVLGSTLEADEREGVPDPDEFDRFADDDFMASRIHALAHRLPALTQTPKPSSYCGLYTVNRIDMHPVIGPTELAGYYVANGFSGHGFKLAPAVGALIAQMLAGTTTSFDTAVPADFFAVDRLPLKLLQMNVLA
ncbi:MAG: FAD-dependent oxidoreductase [Proteobacteria bacterium]|nr:FAD-dependent oxidoreductase [Pseudomonadota bacterium]